MTLTRTEGSTVDEFCRALHYSRFSVGDAFAMHADFFKVFQFWIYNLDSARARVDATKKLDAFKKMYNACLRDARSKGLDVHNWLQRPNQHLMRQPLLLDALVRRPALLFHLGVRGGFPNRAHSFRTHGTGRHDAQRAPRFCFDVEGSG